MTTYTLGEGLGERRASSTAGTGTALTSTAGFIPLLPGTKHVELIARNFATAVAVRYMLNPYLIILRTQDSLATAPTDASQNAQDGSTGTSVTLSSQGTAAQGDFLYVGSHVPFRGVTIDVDGTNSNASVLTVKYRKTDDTWADISATDNTDNGGASLGQDGTVVWTVPSDWQKAALNSYGDPVAATASLLSIGDTSLTFRHATKLMYWTRWEFSAALDSAVTLDHMLAMNRSTTYADMPAGSIDERCMWGPDGFGCVEALTDAGTANLIVNCYAGQGAVFI